MTRHCGRILDDYLSSSLLLWTEPWAGGINWQEKAKHNKITTFIFVFFFRISFEKLLKNGSILQTLTLKRLMSERLARTRGWHSKWLLWRNYHKICTTDTFLNFEVKSARSAILDPIWPPKWVALLLVAVLWSAPLPPSKCRNDFMNQIYV